MTTTAEYSEECEERALEEMEMIRDGLGKGGKLEKWLKFRLRFSKTGGEVAMVMKSSLSSGTEIAFKSYELAKALLDVYVGDDQFRWRRRKHSRLAVEEAFYLRGNISSVRTRVLNYDSIQF